ncbi:GtrA family protein [Rhodococcus kronopolitis]|uniref:GtrA family protein n=1 Tax=Rhodococcus kronopolitis TaxID=1460226 RepID=A0ABV9FY14_9NOCA
MWPGRRVAYSRPVSGTPHAPEPHLPLPVELPLVDEPGGTDVDLKTQLVRFVLTGALSAVVDFTVTMLLQGGLGLPRAVAKSVGFVLGTTTAYLINRRWTFNAPPSRARFVAVVALYAVTFAVQVGIYTALGEVWSDTLLYNALAFVIAQGVATVINFVVQRAVIFKIR